MKDLLLMLGIMILTFVIAFAAAVVINYFRGI